MTDPRLCSEVWTVTHLATHDLGKAHWDMHDMINYTHHHKNDGFHHHHHVDNHGQIIDINDDDYHGHNVYNKHDPWSQYEIYAGLYIRYFYFLFSTEFVIKRAPFSSSSSSPSSSSSSTTTSRRI